MKIVHKEPHGPLRQREYPHIGDQLDAIMKFAAHLNKEGIPLPDETQAWIAQCEAVKQKYPKGKP